MKTNPSGLEETPDKESVAKTSEAERPRPRWHRAAETGLGGAGMPPGVESEDEPTGLGRAGVNNSDPWSI